MLALTFNQRHTKKKNKKKKSNKSSFQIGPNKRTAARYIWSVFFLTTTDHDPSQTRPILSMVVCGWEIIYNKGLSSPEKKYI
jgi:hypothetical protein